MIGLKEGPRAARPTDAEANLRNAAPRRKFYRGSHGAIHVRRIVSKVIASAEFIRLINPESERDVFPTFGECRDIARIVNRKWSRKPSVEDLLACLIPQFGCVYVSREFCPCLVPCGGVWPYSLDVGWRM